MSPRTILGLDIYAFTRKLHQCDTQMLSLVHMGSDLSGVAFWSAIFSSSFSGWKRVSVLARRTLSSNDLKDETCRQHEEGNGVVKKSGSLGKITSTTYNANYRF